MDKSPDHEVSPDQNPFGDLFMLNPEPMWIFDLETWRFLEVNHAASRRYGYTREEFLGEMTIADIRSPEEAARLREAINHTPDHFLEVGTFRHRVRSGETVDMDIATYPLNFRGRPARLVRAIDCAVKRRDGRGGADDVVASQLIEAVGDWVAKFDRNWRFLHVNRVLEESIGLPRNAILGKDVWEILPQIRNTPIELNLREAMLTRQPVRFTWHGSSGMRWLDIRAYPSGEGLSVITRDITDRKRAESRNEELQAQLHHAQRMETLGEMVGGIAHDFNNLLTIMAGSIDRLRALGSSPATTSEPDPSAIVFTRLDMALERASELSRKLLSFSRNDPARFGKTDVNRCLDQTLSLLSESTDRRIEFVTALDPDCRFVLGDPHQLEHVFMNLIINACDALGPRLARSSNGRIHIRTWRGVLPEPRAGAEGLDSEREYLCVLFEDNGEGIPENIRARVFEPFFTTKPSDRGTGLGLTISRETIRAHGGAIAAESTPGEGTRFLIHLPLYESHPAKTTERGNPRARILVIEDEEPLRELLDEMLNPLGYEVVPAENGRRGVELFSADPDGFHAVLMDVNMPGMNGPAAMRAIRALRPAAKIMMMTGYADDRTAAELRKEGLGDILYKPYRSSELREKLSSLLSTTLN